MANEFIARKGLIALDNTQITGSLGVSSTLSIPGFTNVSASLASAIAGGGTITGVTAGDGLTGGGTAGTVTLNVVGGTGITANANDIAVDDTIATVVQLNASSSALQSNIDAKASITQLNASSSALQTNIDAKVSNSSTASFAITGSNVTFAEITASNLDISGDVDIDGTLEADAITVNGTALSTVIAATTVANAVNSTNTTNVNVLATTDNADFFVTMVDGASSDQRVESSTKLKFNPSNGNFFIEGNITASGAISASGVLSIPGFTDVSASLAAATAGDITGVTAGDGLTGGGTSGTVTLNVVGGTGITANANDIAVDATIATVVQLNASSSALQSNIDAKSSITQLNASSSALQSNIDAKASITQLNVSSSALRSNINGKQDTLTFGKLSGNALKSEEALTTNDVLLMGSSNVKGRTYAELKSDLSLNLVENTALSTYTGNGGALDNQYITNGAGYTTNTGTATSVGGTGTVSGLSLSGTVTTSGSLTLGGTISISSTNITDVDAFSQSGTYASLRAQGTTAGDVSLGNVTNESKATMFTSPTFTGTVAIPGFADVSSSLAAATAGGGTITGVTAGDGLTGGGSAGTVTLNVVGGTGITANANDIAVDATIATVVQLNASSSALQTNIDGKQATLTFGKSSGNALKSEEALTTNDVLLMGSSNVKGRTYSQFRSDINVEDGADVTDTTNVTAAGALMDSELSEIATVKALTATGISGSFTAASASFSTRVAANDAKLTANTTNVTSAGALMDSEVTNLAQVKAFDSSDYATSAQGTKADTAIQPSQTSSFSTATGVEDNADVTDATNVTAAGALMDSEVTNLAQVKAFDSSDYATAAQGTKADNAATLVQLNASSSALQSNIDGKQATLTFGKSSGNALKSEEALTTNDVLLMGSSNVKGRTYAELKSDLSLNNVTNESKATMFTSPTFTGTMAIPGFSDVSASLAAASGGGGGDITGVTAGNGLTGGGSSGDVTLTVGAGTGVTVNSGDIAIGQDVSTTSNVTFASIVADNVKASGESANALRILDFDGDGFIQFDGKLSTSNTVITIGDPDDGGNGTKIKLTDAERSIQLGTNSTTHVTASGNISASGTITGNSIVGTLATAAQTNITSLGTLGSLTMGGDIDMDGQTINTNNGQIDNASEISSNAFKMGVGGVSTPALAFTSDANTGLYAVAADTLGIAAGGTNRMTIGNGTTTFSNNNVTMALADGDGAVLSITNTYSGTTSADSYAIKAVGNAVIGIPGGQNQAYAGHFTAGNTNTANPDTIALFAQGHEDGAPNSYAAIFSGSAGGVVGINTMEPTVELDVVGDISASNNIVAGGDLSIQGFPSVSASLAAASGGGGATTYRTVIESSCFLSQTALRYLPFNSLSEQSGFNYLSITPAAADGKVVSITMFPQSSGGSTVVGLHINSNATAATTDTQTISAGTPLTFTFSSGNTFSQNDELSFSVASTSNINGLASQIVLEYDL